MQARSWAVILVLVGLAGAGASMQGRPDTVSGTLTRTYTIVADTDLTGDVTCDVAQGTPCFSFAVPGVELRLNGFSITGRADATTACGATPTAGESGVISNGQSRVSVRGPGLIQRFRNHGVQIAGSTDARVEGLTVSTNCGSGIFVLASSFGTIIEGNTAVRNGSPVTGQACGGIWVVGHNSRVRLNTAHGNGYSEPADDFGIGLIGAASGNVVDENLVTGNTNGVYIAATVGRNAVRNNTAVGNPAIQVSTSQPNARALDILNLAPAERIEFDRNRCLTALNAPCPAVAPQ